MKHPNLTVVTRSAQPFERPVPYGAQYLNHVSTFSDLQGHSLQTLAAYDKVQTDFFVSVDDDDPMIQGSFALDDAHALTYGRVHTLTNLGDHAVEPPLPKTAFDLVRQLHVFHKPIFSTRHYQMVRPFMPKEVSAVEIAILYLMAAVGGCQFQAGYESFWRVRPEGFHRHFITSTFDRLWLKDHGPAIVQRIHSSLAQPHPC